MADVVRKIGRYEVLERVGRGGMGVLYRALDPVLDREVAIKLMSTDFTADESARPRFFREARAAAKLQHRNIVTIFEFAEEEGVPYIVMEFLRGTNLTGRLQKVPSLPLDSKLDIMVQLCTGLHFAHEQGVVHRDVKPPNIWLLEDGTVKLLDFGIAKMASTALTNAGDVLGSAAYMAPEQVEGRIIDGRADVFSAGVVLYELLAGHKPFEADSPTALLLKIIRDEPPPLQNLPLHLPPALINTVGKALQKNADNRYQRAGDLAGDLQAIRQSLPIEQPAVVLPETVYAPSDAAPPPSSRYRTPAGPSPSGSWSAVPVASGTARTATEPPLPYRESTSELWAPPKRRSGLPSVFDRSGGWGVLAGAAGGVSLVIILLFSARMWLSSQPATQPVSAGTTTPAPIIVVQPPKPAPAPTTTELKLAIVTEPSGANINLEGRDLDAVTPATIPLPGSPPWRLRLVKRGYQTYEGRVTEEQARAGTATFQLEAASQQPGTVSITGAYPFEVVEGRRVLGEAAESHRLTLAGRHTLRLRASEYFLDYAMNVDVPPGRNVELRAPELGTLLITVASAVENCAVSLETRDLGYAPFEAQRLAPRGYAVNLDCPNGTRRPFKVSIQPGDTTRLPIR
ncbi:MAG: protein kinase [Acidobacteria bacterium]|nr:protein kinase [Acidobacteriota bacterium]